MSFRLHVAIFCLNIDALILEGPGAPAEAPIARRAAAVEIHVLRGLFNVQRGLRVRVRVRVRLMGEGIRLGLGFGLGSWVEGIRLGLGLGSWVEGIPNWARATHTNGSSS